MKLLRHLVPLVFKNRLTELTYFSTNVCNMQCRHCFVVNELNTPAEKLSVEELKKMGRSIPSMQRVHIGGGEPFTRNDIAEVAIAIANNWNTEVICIPTNGWYCENIVNTVNKFGKESKGKLRLHFSINSHIEEEMDNFTQLKGSFKKWKSSIETVKYYTNHYENITLVALATYNDFNMNSFRQLVDFVLNEIKVDDFSFQLVRSHESYNPKIDIEGFRKIINYYFQYKYHKNPILKAYRELVREIPLNYFLHPQDTPVCTSGVLRVVMSPNGDIYPCEILGYPNGKNKDDWLMGNVREFNYDLQKLLTSNNAIRIKKKIKESRCRCYHGIDSALSLLSTNDFRIKVLLRSIKYMLT